MDQSSVETPKVQRGLRVLVGETWPGHVRVKKSEGRSRLAPGLSVLLAALLVAYSVYGMATADYRIHEKVLEVIRYGLVAAVAWVFGRGAR